MSTHPHLELSLQRDIDQLRRKVTEMADLGEHAIRASLKALTERNRQLAYSIILRDQYIDEMEMELDRLCLEFLVRHQPVAGQLRFVFAAIQINRELERVGDFAESVARQVLTLSDSEPQFATERFAELANLSLHMLKNAVQSFVESDADLAWRTLAIEERANALRNGIYAEMVALVQDNRLTAAAMQPLRTVARRFEGVTDQAKNICEEVLYMCTGEFVKHKGADTFRILFLDETNSSASQMAEAIGRSLNLPRFVFSSAGLKPGSLDSRVVDFLAGQNVSVSHQDSKTIEEVPNWQDYQVLITLGPNVRPPKPLPTSKAIYIKWSTVAELPQRALPSDQEKHLLQETFEDLRTQIKELVGAVLDQPKLESKPR